MMFSCNRRKNFAKHWVREVVSLRVAQSRLWDNQITVIKSPAECQVGFESGTF